MFSIFGSGIMGKYQELLSTWEETYKKGQLTLWIFLSLRDGEKHVTEIREFIKVYSQGTIICDEQSLYRALRKFYEVVIVDFSLVKGNRGPDKKYYFLTPLGEKLLKEFLERNIRLFFNEKLVELINKK